MVPPCFRVDVDVVDLVIPLDDHECARALPLEAHNLRCAPKMLVLGAQILVLHLLRDVIVGDEDGLVSFPFEELDIVLAAAEKSRLNEQAIRDEIATGAVHQSWMEKMFKANGID